MPPRPQKTSKTLKVGAKSKVEDGDVENLQKETVSLPMYISMVGVHTTLLAFTGLFLPRASTLQDFALYDANTPLVSSQDRPQYPFLQDLTRSPTITLFALCVGALILQGWWASWLKRSWIDTTSHGTPEELLQEKYPPVGERAKELGRAYGVVLLASIGLHFIAILFGAPITNLVAKTYFLALLISILSLFPAAYILGPPTWSSDSPSLVKRWIWLRLFAELSPRNTVERALVYPFLGVAIGSWIGIIPIALDWDRPWQAWPLTPAYGALAGYIVASIIAVTVDAIVLQKTSIKL